MTATTAGGPLAAGANYTRGQRARAIFSAWAGFAMDSYSLYIVNTALIPALAYFQGENPSPTALTLLAGGTLAASLLGRPLGALLFGHFADRIGRKRVGFVSIMGFGVVSLLVAFTPGAQLVGDVTAIGILLLLRFIDGIFLGGEYTAATPLAFEYMPAKHRGFFGGLVQCAASGGPFFVALFVSLVLIVAPAGDINSPYVQWGWRIPFFLGFVLAIIVAFFLRRRVDDSETWREAQEKKAAEKQTRSPLIEMFRGGLWKAFLQAWVIATGIFFVSDLSTIQSQYLLTNPGFTAAKLAHVSLITPLPGMAAYVFMGWVSDKIGRKKAFFISGPVGIVVLPIVLTTIGLGRIDSFWLLALLAVIFNVVNGASFGVIGAFTNERFPTSVRSSGWGVAYSTAVIIPSFFAYYQVWLSHIIPLGWTGGVIGAFGALLITLGAIPGKETRGIDLRDAGTARGTREYLDAHASEQAHVGEAVTVIEQSAS